MTEQVSRRTALAAGLAGVGALAGGRRLVSGPAAQARKPGRSAAAIGIQPNILWLVSEDNNPFLGSYGDPIARTPTLDQFASEGVRYANCFSAAPVCAPSRFALITGMYATSTGPAEHMRASGHPPVWLRGFPELLRAAGYYCTNNAKTDYNVQLDMAAMWDESSPTAHWRDRPAGTPFFSVFNFDTTHEHMVFPNVSAPLPGGVSPGSVRIPAYQPDTATARAGRALYYDQITRMDEQIAQMLGQLAADGLAENTIVFYYSDNGGVLPRSKHFAYDSGLSTPLIIRFPAPYATLSPGAPGSVVRNPVSSVDFAPTVLSLTGIAAPPQMNGIAFAGPRRRIRTYAFASRDRTDERYDMQRTVRTARYRYIRNYLPHLPSGQYQKYVFQQTAYREWQRLFLAGGLPAVQATFWQEKPAEELYDLRTDRDEVRNLVDSAAHATILANLRQRLDEHMVAVNDNGFIPEGSPMEGYDASRVPGSYPMAQVLGVAATAIERQAGNADQLVAWLADPNVIVRLWAAHGCRMMPGGVPAAVPELTRLLSDDYPAVCVAAAEALCVSGEVASGLDTLQGILLGGVVSWYRLQAANALDSLGALARPVLPALEQASADKDRHVADSASHTVAVLNGTYKP